MAVQEHEGWEYCEVAAGTWSIISPDGVVYNRLKFASEEEVKNFILEKITGA